MDFRLISESWEREILAARERAPDGLQIICPFIKERAIGRIIAAGKRGPIDVITRFDLNCFDQGVSDLAALERLLDRGGRVRGLRGVHAKLYLFGGTTAIATSANVTDAAMRRNHEFGFSSSDGQVVAACTGYFEQLWAAIGKNLSWEQIQDWRCRLDERRKIASVHAMPPLPDFGAEVPLGSPFALPESGAVPANYNDAFVKFSGTARDRADRALPIDFVVAESGCGWAFTFPTSRHPRQVADGDLLYIGRLVHSSDDLMIFGKALGRRHRDAEDVASEEDLALRPWKATWGNYVRVHDGRFIDATLGDGISLREMLGALGSDSFASTQGNARRGEGNTDPFRSYWRKPIMELTDRSRAYIEARLDEKLRRFGEVDLTQPRFAAPGLSTAVLQASPR